jgi:fatty acid desaturase
MAGMNDVPREILRSAYKRNALHLLKIPFAFGVWFLLGRLLLATKDSPYALAIGCACSLLVAYLIRGLGAIAHDAVHGNLSRNKTLSYWISLLCWSPTGMSVTIYSNYHLHHHRITNTYPDVDNFVVTDYTRNPVLAKLMLLAVYTFAYPIYFLFQMMRYTKRLSTWHKLRMNVELLGIFGVVALGYTQLPFQVFFFLFGLPFILGAMFASMTSMIEHFGMPATDDDAYSSRTYGTKAGLTNFLWNNVTYHNEHHKYPGIPFYNLARFHHTAYPHYEKRVQQECYGGIWSLALKLYGDIFRLDIGALSGKYANIDKRAERDRVMLLPGISAETTS